MEMSTLKTFKIPVYWEVTSVIEIEAESVEEAIRIFDETEQNDNGGFELPTDPEYVTDSFNREDEELIKEFNTLIETKKEE